MYRGPGRQSHGRVVATSPTSVITIARRATMHGIAVHRLSDMLVMATMGRQRRYTTMNQLHWHSGHRGESGLSWSRYWTQ